MAKPMGQPGQRIAEWTDEQNQWLRDFWHWRDEWQYHRTRSVVAARESERLMTEAASKIVDAGLVKSGPMPTIAVFHQG